MRRRDRQDAFAAELLKSGAIPQNVVETLLQATADLVVSKRLEQALMAGQIAPTFNLKDAEGIVVDSAKLLVSGPLVVTFYRSVSCPYCKIDLKALEEARTNIETKGASLVALSMQNGPLSRCSRRENGLGFPILVDKQGVVADAFGLRFKFSIEVAKTYRDILKNDLEAYNDDRSWTLPMPARYVIGQDGVIAYAEVNPDFTRNPDPSELFPVLDQLARTASRALQSAQHPNS